MSRALQASNLINQSKQLRYVADKLKLLANEDGDYALPDHLRSQAHETAKALTTYADRCELNADMMDVRG